MSAVSSTLSCSEPVGVARWEACTVGVLIGVSFLAGLAATLLLDRMQAFDQYNVYFDTDPNQYISAVADGWSFNRDIHPGFALFFNVPVRAVSFVIGLADSALAAKIRAISPLLVPALCGAVGLAFFWRATVLLGFGPVVRVGTLLLLAGSFSQLVYVTIPESYSVSGMLYAVLLWMAARALADERQGRDLGRRSSRLAWLTLAVVMAGVTITNGVACVAAWFALRVPRYPLRNAVAEAAVGCLLVGIAILAMGAADKKVYTIDVKNHSAYMVSEIAAFGPGKSRFVPESVGKRLIALPAHFGAAVVAPTPTLIPIAIKGRAEVDRYDEGFSLTEPSERTGRILVSWLVLLVVVGLIIRRLDAMPMAPVLGILFLFNLAIHGAWGKEVFLYSQHWTAVVVMAMGNLAALGGCRAPVMFLLAAVAVAGHNGYEYAQMIQRLG